MIKIVKVAWTRITKMRNKLRLRRNVFMRRNADQDKKGMWWWRKPTHEQNSEVGKGNWKIIPILQGLWPI